MFKFAVAILAAVALIGAVGVQADCSGGDMNVSPGSSMTVEWAFASSELQATVTDAGQASTTGTDAQTLTIQCGKSGTPLTCSKANPDTVYSGDGCSLDFSDLAACESATEVTSLTGYTKADQYELTGTMTWKENYLLCRGATTGAGTPGSREVTVPWKLTVTLPTEKKVTDGVEVFDTWNTGLIVKDVTISRHATDEEMGIVSTSFDTVVQYPYKVGTITGYTTQDTCSGVTALGQLCVQTWTKDSVFSAFACNTAAVSESLTLNMACISAGSDCPFHGGTYTSTAAFSVGNSAFCPDTEDGAFTLEMTSHHPSETTGCGAAQDDFYYEDSTGTQDEICLRVAASVTATQNFAITSVSFVSIKISGSGTETVTGTGSGTTSADQVVGTKDFGNDLASPAFDSSTSVTFEATVSVGYGGGSKRRGLLSVASQTLTHTVSLSRGTAGNGAAAAATADNSLVTATSTTSSASTIAIIVGAVAVVSLVAVIAGVAVRRNNQQNAKSVAAMEAALRKANDTAAPKEEVEAASASTTAADSAVSASSSSGEYYYYSYTTASSSV